MKRAIFLSILTIIILLIFFFTVGLNFMLSATAIDIFIVSFLASGPVYIGLLGIFTLYDILGE